MIKYMTGLTVFLLNCVASANITASIEPSQRLECAILIENSVHALEAKPISGAAGVSISLPISGKNLICEGIGIESREGVGSPYVLVAYSDGDVTIRSEYKAGGNSIPLNTLSGNGRSLIQSECVCRITY